MKRYILVVQDTRGQGNSEGVDSVFLQDGWRDDKWDGWDTVEWIKSQSWCNGKVGTYGASALGITQYLLAGAHHSAHLCGVPFVASWDMYRNAVMPGGEYRQNDIDAWLSYQNAMYMKDYFADHYVRDTVWDWLDVGTRVDSVTTAFYHIGGWYDFFSQGTVEAFQALKHLGNKRLLMGPWSHFTINTPQVGEVTFPNAVLTNLDTLVFKWFDYWLKGTGDISDIPTVYYYLMGPVDTSGYWNDWYEADDWPPTSDSVVLYLRSGGSLSFEEPGFEAPDLFVYDPRNPVPTVGGNNLALPAGPYDQDSVWTRPDVLTYITEPLQEDLVVTGDVKLRLYFSSDRLDTDFTAKLVDVYPDGRKMLILDGIKMARHRLGLDREDFLTPGEVYEMEIDLWPTAYVFPAGHRVGLAISSSNWPRFRLNLNNGGHPLRDTTDTLIATNVVYHDLEHPSALVLRGTGGQGISGVAAKPRLLAFPNPFSMELTVSGYRGPARLYDAAGRLVRELWLESGNPVKLNLGPGVYFLKTQKGILRLIKAH